MNRARPSRFHTNGPIQIFFQLFPVFLLIYVGTNITGQHREPPSSHEVSFNTTDLKKHKTLFDFFGFFPVEVGAKMSRVTLVSTQHKEKRISRHSAQDIGAAFGQKGEKTISLIFILDFPQKIQQ